MRVANPTARQGEDLASEYLKRRGYRVIDRNFRIRYGEIDIVAIEDRTLVFIEVKTRTTDEFGSPFEAITPWKLKQLIRSAQYYKLTHPSLPEQLRIDAIAVTIMPSGLPLVELRKNISGF